MKDVKGHVLKISERVCIQEDIPTVDGMLYKNTICKVDSLEESIEFFYLDFCRRLLQASSMITQKLLGLILIMDKVEMIMPRVKDFMVTKDFAPNPMHFSKSATKKPSFCLYL